VQHGEAPVVIVVRWCEARCPPPRSGDGELVEVRVLPAEQPLDHLVRCVEGRGRVDEHLPPDRRLGARYGVDTVAVLPCPELDGPALRRLGWQLEKTRAELLLAPAVTEIVGPRVRIRPVCGLPLLHMERPELRGIRRLTKEAFDRASAFFGLLRNGVLFKMKADPRVTPIGKLLRRYSLDELPQLFNVVTGHMSLVVPRPPLPSKVERYGFDMHRRFLVKPGLTGLWHVSGRSDLSSDDSVRIDVRYVENWSLTFDFMILWKTVGAVLRGRGAY
jgi:hypothetical protein